MLVDKERQDSTEPDGEPSEREGLRMGKNSTFSTDSQPSPGSAAASRDLGPIV